MSTLLRGLLRVAGVSLVVSCGSGPAPVASDAADGAAPAGGEAVAKSAGEPLFEPGEGAGDCASADLECTEGGCEENCTKATGVNFARTCKGGGCKHRCEGATCRFDCPGGGCQFDCVDADCTLVCAGGGCKSRCRGGGKCSVMCDGGGCKAECGEGTECLGACLGGGCEGNVEGL